MVQRVEVYYNDNEGLSVMEFSWTNDGDNKRLYLSKRLQGKKAEQYMNGLASSLNITKIEGYNGYVYKIFYEDGRYVSINDANVLIESGLIQGYFNHVYDYVTKKKETLAPKVTRKNKHTGGKIIATGFVALALIFVSYCAFQGKDDNKDIGYNTTATVTKMEATVVLPTTTPFDEILDVPTPEYTTKNPEDDLNTPTLPPSVSTIPATTEKVPVTDDIDVVSVIIDYSVRSDLGMEKLEKTRRLYGDMIQKYAKMYGLDAELVIALATQERGEHSPVTDPGGGTGLMQIQNSVWVGATLTAYNFETCAKETVCITRDMISDCETNIKLGCMILQGTLKSNNYNLLMGIQSYNMGSNGVAKAVNAYVEANGMEAKDVRNSQNDTGWLDYRYLVGHGDPEYLEHIFSYMGNDIVLEFYKPDGTLVTCNVRNYTNTKSR